MIINSPIESTAFYILNFPIKFYGIIMSSAILIGIILSIYLYSKNNSQKETELFSDSIPITTISSIIGARIFYVIGDFNYYKENLTEIIKINHGGISIWGAIIFAIATIFFYSKTKKINFLKYLDYYSLVMPLCQAIGRWGNFFNQEAYGLPTSGIIKLYIDEKHRYHNLSNINYYHPTFLYESILDLIIFMVLFLIYKKEGTKKNGKIFYLYLILYSIIRIIIEQIRIDSILNIGSFSIATIISIFILLIALKKYINLCK